MNTGIAFEPMVVSICIQELGHNPNPLKFREDPFRVSLVIPGNLAMAIYDNLFITIRGQGFGAAEKKNVDRVYRANGLRGLNVLIKMQVSDDDCITHRYVSGRSAEICEEMRDDISLPFRRQPQEHPYTSLFCIKKAQIQKRNLQMLQLMVDGAGGPFIFYEPTTHIVAWLNDYHHPKQIICVGDLDWQQNGSKYTYGKPKDDKPY